MAHMYFFIKLKCTFASLTTLGKTRRRMKDALASRVLFCQGCTGKQGNQRCNCFAGGDAVCRATTIGWQVATRVAGCGVCACKCKLKSMVSFNKKVFACSRTEALKERTGKRSSSMRGLCTQWV